MCGRVTFCQKTQKQKNQKQIKNKGLRARINYW